MLQIDLVQQYYDKPLFCKVVVRFLIGTLQVMNQDIINIHTKEFQA